VIALDMPHDSWRQVQLQSEHLTTDDVRRVVIWKRTNERNDIESELFCTSLKRFGLSVHAEKRGACSVPPASPGDPIFNPNLQS